MNHKILEKEIRKYSKKASFSMTYRQNDYSTYPIVLSQTQINRGKVRRVSNAASIFKENSLNNLLSGPNFINNSVVLLLHFREHWLLQQTWKPCWCISLSWEKNQPAVHFLRPSTTALKQCQFTRLIFGARCSPSNPIFVSQQIADVFAPTEQNKQQF